MIHVDFRILISHAGSEDGARQLFQRLVASLVRLRYKDAREIRPCPGDWGIDVLVGELTGVSLVWQAKYFIDGLGDPQKAQIRESFDQLMSRSKEKHFAVDVWSLCVPCSLSPDETRWWEKWKKGQKEKGYSLRIDLIDETTLRSDLDAPDAEHIKMGYFGPSPTIVHYFLQALQGHPEREIQTLPELSLYQESLFIRKLVAAGINEVRSAKTQFFNAELLTQEITDKGDPREITSVHSLQEKLRSVWETRFNEACAEPQNRFGNLYPGTMRAIEEQDATSLRSPDIKASFVHKQGIVHQLANNCEVGWTKDFRNEFKKGE